jgi:hypothetical protein
MSKLSRARVGVLTAGILIGAVGVAEGARPGIFAGAQKESRAEAEKLARTAITAKRGPSAVFAARPPYGRVAARSTKRLAEFPRSGKSFLILSNGDALLADNSNSAPDSGQSAGGPAIRGARDVTIFRINLRVPKGHNCLGFSFRYLTEEFPEFVNQQFNDAFIAELDETNWDARGVGDPNIDSPRNFAVAQNGQRISVNAVGDTAVSAANAKGTTYDGATRVLRARTRITPGVHRLYLSIFDQGDRQFDSAVFVDKISTASRASCASGAVVD